MPTRTEEIPAKGTGAARTDKPATEGPHGVFKKLTEEHGEIGALLMRVKATADPEARRAMYPKVRQEMLAHDHGEIREVYPAFARYPELRPMAGAHDAGATRLERSLDELSGVPPTDPSWGPLFDELVELAVQHTREEEEEYFPAAERVLGRDEAERLQVRYEAAKREVTGRAS